MTMMHKYMCRTPPEEKTINENNETFLVARQKLKQTETTPASPSPPLEQQINIIKPVVIPTEKIETPFPQNNWVNWKHPTNIETPKIKLVGNNKEIIPVELAPKRPQSRRDLPLPPAPQSLQSLEKEILPLTKPPLSDKDLQDLLSPVTESSSGGHSPIFNEDMDLDKLEALKAKLCRELEDEKPKISKLKKCILPKKPPKIIKEQENIFGSLLSSIDEQIITKTKEKKTDKKVLNKKDVASMNEKVKSIYLKQEEKPKVKEIDDKVSKTVEDIMKNLKDSINTNKPDPLSKFGDLVKEKSDQLNPGEVEKSTSSSGRLSDKYPHKRKSIESPSSPPPSQKGEPVKLVDPRLRVKSSLGSPPLKEPIIIPQQPVQQQQQQHHHQQQQQRNFNKPPNSEFSFQNSFNNMNNFNQRNNIFCNEPPQNMPFSSPRDDFLPPNGRPVHNPRIEPFINQGEQFGPPRTPGDQFRSPGDQFGPPRTPGDQFGPPRTPGDQFRPPVEQFGPPRTPVDQFGPPRTPVDQFGPPRTPGDPFGPPRTPGDPFMSPGDPFLNQGRPPGPIGPPGPPNFNQFQPNEPPMRNPQFRNEFHDRFPQNQNWRPFPPNQNNQRFPPPDQNQYDLSQMNPIDFFDNNNRFEPDFNNPSFRGGRGNCNMMRGNFRGRGGVCPERDRNQFRDPRQPPFRGPMLPPPPPPLPMQNKFPPNNEEPPHKEERRSRFDDPREARDHRGDRDYRRSRFSNKEEEVRNERPRSSEDRFSRFGKEPRKPAFVREDPRRKSEEEKLKEDVVAAPTPVPAPVVPVVEKPVEKTTGPEVLKIKEKEEIQSPLDSLYSTETKRVGKGYGLQSFKIPKIKKVEEPKEEPKVVVTTPTPPTAAATTTTEVVKEDPPKEEPLPSKEELNVDASTPEPGPSDEPPKTEADVKLDMFNNFMKHIFETCDSSVLFQYLDRCGFALPNAKTKRIRRIIDSDSSDTEDESKKEEDDKPTPEPPLEETSPEPEEKQNELNEPDPKKSAETLSERIKSRRRKPVIYSSDSSPDKPTKKEDVDDPKDCKEEQISPHKPPKQKGKKAQAKTRRKNALELLQEDIREMFISEGVLTATGKRMCRMMKEHQESGFIAPEGLKQKDMTTESEEEVPLTKRKEKKTLIKSPEPAKRPTRKSPRVVLEKLEISKTEEASDKESDSETEMKKPNIPTRRTRRSNTVSGEFLELDENGVVSKVKDKKKQIKTKIEDPAEADPLNSLDTSFEDEAASVKSDVAEGPVETTDNEEPKSQDVPKKKRIRRRGRGGWATGVIKNKPKKKLKGQEKNPDSPALTISTDPQESDPEEPTKEDVEDEYSLLKVDINEDVNYYLDNGNKFHCKLCDYKGKLIVHHYRSKHPESENMISRLSPEQASAAKIESKEFNFEEIVPYEEATKGKKRRTTFICRFCLLTFKQEFTCSFFDHICCHTGEYRYKCEKCAFSTGVKKTLSTHCHSLHPEMEKPLTIKPIYEGPPNFRLVFGYLCSACNFTQLLKENLEKHVRVSHPDQDIATIKISMSTKPIPLTDLKKPGDDPPVVPLEVPESPKRKKQSPESPKTPKRALKVDEPEVVVALPQMEIPQNELLQKEPLQTEPLEKEPLQTELLQKDLPQKEVPQKELPPKDKEPNLTVFMVPEEISEQEKLIESERLKKMEEIQSNVVPRRSKLQFVDKLKNKLDSVESEIALLESMEAENAALEAEANPPEAAPFETEDPLKPDNVEAVPETPETIPAPKTKLEDDWISIASTCSLANTDPIFEEPEEEPLNPMDILSQNTKKTGFMDTIQRLAAQLQNKAPSSSLSDCEDNTERLYYSPEVTPENSPKRKPQQEEVEEPLYKLNAGCIEIHFFSNKNNYNCLIPGCSYTTFLKTSFRKHLMDDHKNLRVNCGLCVDENDFMEWDLCGLFLHMLDQHKQQTPRKPPPVQIKEEPIEQQPLISIKTEVVSPEKQPEATPAGSIRLRRISGDILSSFSSENTVEYPTISIPEKVVSEPDIKQILGQEQPEVNETGFLQISNVRTLTPEEESHLQIKTPIAPPAPKVFKKIIPKTFILNMGELATSGVTKIMNNPGSSINVRKDGTTFNFTLNPKNEANPADNKTTKTIIFRKPAFDSNVPKLTALSLPKALITSRKITFVAPNKKAPLSVLKAPIEPEFKSEVHVSKMLEYPQILEFYKCPCVECTFSTNERPKFAEHFASHNKTTPGKYCVYCSVTMPPNDLLDHLERLHGNCNFQCALCFYRAYLDTYIAVHQSASHKIDIPKYYRIPPNPQLSVNAIKPDDGVLSRTDAIQPYHCTLEGCNRTFYQMNDFRVHMKLYHKRHNFCMICKQDMVNCGLLIGHYVTHNLGNFQCRYCKFGSEKPQLLLKHYTLEHYNKKAIAYKREYKPGTTHHQNETPHLEDIMEIDLTFLTKQTTRLVPENPPETQNHIPAATSTSPEIPAPQIELEEPLNEAPVTPELQETPSSEELLIDPATGELIPVVNTDEEDEDEFYERSRLKGAELYICGTSECGAKFDNSKGFKDHLYSCDVLKNDEGWYTCFHCKKRFKYVQALINHIHIHSLMRGPEKYHCSLCPAKSHQESLIIKHMKMEHKTTVTKIIPIDKQSPDPAVKQRVKKSRKDDELYEKELQDAIKYTREQIQLIENEKPKPKEDDKNSFGPEDIDKLPRPPIFAHEVKCKICSYSTKVRSNMLIHLKAHIDNKPVAEIAPVNPVPCLEKNELMFDKMTNLAASSHSGGRMGPKPPKDKLTVDYPGFIQASKRYVCGSIGCNYLTHGDSMLRHHLTALHIDEANYKCPHCQIELAGEGLNVLAVDNILFHLKMHDLHLYKCTECQFYHYQKHKMERHLVEQHASSSKSSYGIVRELDSSANVEVVRQTAVTTDKPPDTSDEPFPWRCGFCDFKCASRTSVQAHAANVHKIRSQFKCGSCEFRCSAKNNYQTHFKNKHPSEKVVILSVYYKVTDESSSNLSSSDVETTSSRNSSFDTTPLWTKNKTGVKHIRGILLDDSPIAKRPKIIEKMSENVIDEDKSKIKPRSPQKSSDAGHNLRFPATYGSNRMRFYVCPTCNSFETKNSKQFVIHLYKEINYFRYMCNFCTHKSTHMAEAQKHFKELHSDEHVVSNKQICTVLRYYAKAEKWVEKCLQIQQEGIQQYENELIKQETNSSTETLLLQDPEFTENPDEQPLLTPQNRRTPRASKSNLNDSFELNETTKNEELSPPILEPQIPDLKPPKKSLLKCDHCPFVAKAVTNLNKHIKKHFEAKPYKCNLCSYVGSQLAHLQSHFYFKHTSEPLQYTLNPIPEVPQVHPIKRKRSISETTEPPAKIPALEELPLVKAEPLEIICAESSDLDTTPVKVKAEVGDQSNTLYLCFHCPRRSPSLDLIREHFLESHEKIHKNLFKYKRLTIEKPRKKEYFCNFCNWKGVPDGLKHHHLAKHIDKEYDSAKEVLVSCEHCGEVFRKVGLFKKHYYRSHTELNMLYRIVTKENHDEYIESIEVIEEILGIKAEESTDLNCEYCVLTFTNLPELRAHHDIAHNHLSFNFVDEGESSSMKDSSTKDELKKYKCPQCQHTSNSFPAMRDHLRNHNKPYKCGYCEITASYPNVIKNHHMKEHRNLEAVVLVINEAHRRNEELRDNLLHLVNGEYVKMKENLKRSITDEASSMDEKTSKIKRRKIEFTKSPIKKVNVARKSTATPPRILNTARKSTTPRPQVDQGFTYYGTKPLLFDEIKNIKTELPILGKNMSLNIGSMSQILQLFPVVLIDDIAKKQNI